MLPRLTAYRGVAALAVFWYHIETKTHWIKGPSVASLGYVGVASSSSCQASS